MTKHLRLIMLSLLAMICLGGYSQSDELYKTLSFPDGNQEHNKVGAYDKTWTAQIGTDTWTISNFNNNNWDWSSIKCGSQKFASKASIATDTDLGAAITKVVVEYGTVGNAKNIKACYLQVASDANFQNIIERKSTTQLTTKTKETVFIITEPAVGRYFKVVYELTKASKNGFVEIKNVKYFTKSDKTDSQINFKEAAKEVELRTEMLSLSDLISNPHNLPLTYSTSDKETAAELDGTLHLYKTGKVTVTASFAGDDTYAATKTSMELTIVDNRQDADIHFAKDSYTADFANSTFNGAELVKPEGLEVAYEITPKTEGVSIEKDGSVNYPAVEATYTVTAKFAGNDTYKPATATYTLNVVDNRQDAGIHFANDSYTADITGGTFNEAVLVKPEGINKVIYTISPESEGVSIAEDGTVTYPAVEAIYTVTAEFNGDDTYKPATATYTLNVVDPNFETRTVEFVAGVDKTTQMTPGDDSMSKGIITISSDRAAFGNDANYRFYKGVDSKKGETTISTKYGTITKIEFVHADTKPLSNLSTQVGEYKYDGTTEDAVWTGNSKSVLFTATEQARASKITVTVKVPIAKDYTLDENSVNTIEAYENANVTLKRTFYKDGEWNTLCLPFAVADAKTAFDGAELREVDTQNSNGNTIVFKEATAIEAGKPYLIKWANSSSVAVNVEKKFEGVTLVAAATPVVVKEGGISFNGFYKMTAASELGASVAAIGAGNKLFKVNEGEMKGFRAAFVLSSGAEATGYKVVIDGTATGIEDLVIDGVKANGRVYNLNGQYVGNSLNGLQPGLYIQNGKKIVVK